MKTIYFIGLTILMGLVLLGFQYTKTQEQVENSGKNDIYDERKMKIIEAIESDSDNRVADIHIWRVGITHYAAIISLVTHFAKPPDHYKNILAGFKELSHVTVEVNQCHEKSCLISTST